MKAKYTNREHTTAKIFGGASGAVAHLIRLKYLPEDLEIEAFETPAEVAEREKREAEARQSIDKMTGVKFDGVMCSATAKDQFGLASLESRIRQGMEFNFVFENDEKLRITPDNIDAFEAVWFPFRMSFFN